MRQNDVRQFISRCVGDVQPEVLDWKAGYDLGRNGVPVESNGLPRFPWPHGVENPAWIGFWQGREEYLLDKSNGHMARPLRYLELQLIRRPTRGLAV